MANAKDIACVFECLSLKYQGRPVDKTSLNKLLYYAQGHTLAELGCPLFDNQIDAWEHGPVVAVVYSGYDRIVERAEQTGMSGVQIAPRELGIVMDVWKQYGSLKANELVSLTHAQGTPWAQTYAFGRKNNHIPNDLIKAYFSEPEHGLKHALDAARLPAIDAIPAGDYDPDEDAVWEALA